jgi:hypothetical protein
MFVGGKGDYCFGMDAVLAGSASVAIFDWWRPLSSLAVQSSGLPLRTPIKRGAARASSNRPSRSDATSIWRQRREIFEEQASDVVRQAHYRAKMSAAVSLQVLHAREAGQVGGIATADPCSAAPPPD